jgi:hypothetical protein
MQRRRVLAAAATNTAMVADSTPQKIPGLRMRGEEPKTRPLLGSLNFKRES